MTKLFTTRNMVKWINVIFILVTNVVSVDHDCLSKSRDVVMSCMRVCRKQALSRVKYYYATISKIQQATIMTV